MPPPLQGWISERAFLSGRRFRADFAILVGTPVLLGAFWRAELRGDCAADGFGGNVELIGNLGIGIAPAGEAERLTVAGSGDPGGFIGNRFFRVMGQSLCRDGCGVWSCCNNGFCDLAFTVVGGGGDLVTAFF